MNGTPHCRRVIYEIEDPVGLCHSVDIQTVHTQQLNKQCAIERVARDVIEVHTSGRIVVPNIQSEILLTQSKRLHGIDVFHHYFPKWRRITIAQSQLGDTGLQHFEHERIWCSITVLRNCPDLVSLSSKRVFVSNSKHFSIVECLA